jgi:two-component system response regulator HydG
MTTPVLVVDDDQSVCLFLQEALSAKGFRVVTRNSAAAALAALEDEDFAVLVTDVRMPREGGLELCRKIVASRPRLPIVVITAFGNMETAVAALRAGAYDFVTKPFDIDLLTLTLDRAVQHRQLHDEVRRLRMAAEPGLAFEELTGDSPPMQRLYRLIDRVADSDSSVMIAGESGTGKELVARAIHRRSARRERPFVAINCAALPEPLLESELFGHARGAFTDARGSRAGLFVSATGGTLFLDELGELPLGLQPKLLRALQERRVRPLGGEAEIPFDVRIVAATNRDLQTLIAEKRFRDDLYYRLDVIPIEMPPLRHRGNDVLLLAQRFVAQYAARAGRPIGGISGAAAAKLLAYHWPGNVRELQNWAERAVTLALFDEIGVDDLPVKIRDHAVGPLPEDDLVPLGEVERRYILRVLEASGGNRAAAARVLGLDRTTLWRKLEQYAASQFATDVAKRSARKLMD